MEPRERLYVALDDDGGPDFVAGETDHPLVAQLRGKVGGFKVGSIIFDMIGTLAGGYGVKTIGEPIMLDLKWLETPDAMERIGDRTAREFDCEFCTVHARGGVEAMRALRDAAFKIAETQARRHDTPVSEWMTKILGVTILTSETYDGLLAQRLVRTPRELYDRFSGGPKFQQEFEQNEVERLILRFSKDVKSAGLDGVVCPSRFTAAIRKEFGPDFIIVNPDIRFAGEPRDNHVQPATPGEAIANGADYVVMERSITKAADPVATARRAVREITEALAKRA